MNKLTLSALVVIASSAVASAAFADDIDLAAGKTAFNKCLACHAIGEGAKNKVGPVLNGLDGRKTGTQTTQFTLLPALSPAARWPNAAWFSSR